MSLTDLLTDLEVLSMIKENDKLCMRNGHITIEQKTNRVNLAIRRWYNNDSRKNMIMEIDKIITQALSASSKARGEEGDEAEWKLNQFIRHFKNITDGLENLKKTYFDDSFVVARLSVMVELLNQEIIRIA